MLLNELLTHYARQPQTKALAQLLRRKTLHKTVIGGLAQSAVSMYFAAVHGTVRRCMLFIMRDADEAGYLFQDLSNILGDKEVEENTVSLRSRKDGDLGASPLEDVIAKIVKENAEKSR